MLKRVKRVIKQEQYDYLARMDSLKEKGIAINEAIRENIFAIITCINNDLPLFLYGSPGTGKTLSVRVVQSTIFGESSSDGFFRTLPELRIVDFQGTENTRSEEIEKAFEKANNLLIKNKQLDQKVKVVLIADEMGLAEKSPHNPLKVLHEKLDPFYNLDRRREKPEGEKEEEKKEPAIKQDDIVGFIGISNYKLDLAKMSRTLVLARGDPPQKKLESTCIKLYEMLKGTQEDCKELIKIFALAFIKLKEEFRNEEGYRNWFANRDLYYAVRALAKEEYKTKINLASLKRLIYVNFGGAGRLLNHFSEVVIARNVIQEAKASSNVNISQLFSNINDEFKDFSLSEIMPLKIFQEA